jgi:hypothetical protein
LIDKKFVHASYVVAIGYVFADTYDKSSREFKKSGDLTKSLITAGKILIYFKEF